MLQWFKSRIAENGRHARHAAAADAAPSQVRAPQTPKERGDEHVRAGRYADAERSYREVIESDADHPAALVMLGFVLREQGRTNEAREVLERAVKLADCDADSHYLLASTLEATGPRDVEISHLQRAIQLRPDFEFARLQLIVALSKSGRGAEATEVCEKSLAILPNSGELHFYRSNLHALAGEVTLAIATCKRALALNPALIAAQQSLSRLSVATGQLEQAADSYRKEIELAPEHFGPHLQLGVALHQLGRRAEAISAFERAVSLNPRSAVAYHCLARAHVASGSDSQCVALALASYEKAAELEPENGTFHRDLGLSYWHNSRPDRAMASFDKAIELNPNDAKARWARVMAWIPAPSSEGADLSADRSAFEAELARFEEWWRKSDVDGADFVGEMQPFYLAYQEESNLALLQHYGRICVAAMQRWLDRQGTPASQRPLANRIRLGVVSSDVRTHSVWRALIKGWLQSLDPNRFEVIIFSLAVAAAADAETSWARSRADVFVEGLTMLDEWVAAIREQNCEILLYPAVGMCETAGKLAALRLAPVQINTWGHPETSGFPTLDYFVSATCFEPTDAQQHYSERLILLPHLGSRVPPTADPVTEPDFAAMNIDLKKRILVCSGTPFKYVAEHDHVFVEIARRRKDAQLIFFRWPVGIFASLLEARIAKAFQAAGLDFAKHVRFIHWLPRPQFDGLLRRADVLLDTIGFSGYNTALRAIECGLPLVTREGRFLRGRLASGILRRMGLTELIAQTKAEYVDLVVRLTADRDYQESIRHKIQQRRSVLFDDQSAMGELQNFLESTARPARFSRGETSLGT